MATDFKRVLEKAESYKPAISRFLRDLIALPSESCQEKEVIRRIKQEMEAVGFDRVEVDPMGNVLGYIGHGRHLIAMDAHIDNVGVGNPENWKFDPFKGYEDDEVIGGRGASDQTGGMASLVYAGKIIKDLTLTGDYTLLVTGTVRRGGLRRPVLAVPRGEERDPAGVRGLHRADVVSIHRGQRGRMEIKVAVRGISATVRRRSGATTPSSRWVPSWASFKYRTHAWPTISSWVRGLSPCPRSSHVAQPVRRGGRLHHFRGSPAHGRRDPGGGPGGNPARPAVKQAGAQVSLYDYARPSYTGLVYPTECYFAGAG